MNMRNMDKDAHDLENISFSSSHRRCSIKIGVLKNFPKYTGKHPGFFDKVGSDHFSFEWKTQDFMIVYISFLLM